MMAKGGTSAFRSISLIAAALCALCLPQKSPAAAIRGWGWLAINSAESGRKDFVAISAGYEYSLALQRVCEYELVGDLNDDCEVDFEDFGVMCGNWLVDCYVEPVDPACVAK